MGIRESVHDRMQGFLVTISDPVDSGQTHTLELKPNLDGPSAELTQPDGKSPAPSNRVVGRNGSQGCDFGSRPHQRDGRFGSLSAVPV